jgi:hypothetical protein
MTLMSHLALLLLQGTIRREKCSGIGAGLFHGPHRRSGHPLQRMRSRGTFFQQMAEPFTFIENCIQVGFSRPLSIATASTFLSRILVLIVGFTAQQAVDQLS